MKCPRDGELLQNRRLEAGVEVDECARCGGVWLERGELEALQKAHANDVLPAETDADEVRHSFAMARQDHGAHDPCPRCQDLMDRREYAWGSQVMADVCPHGDGLWLDSGELEQLEAYFAREHARAPEPPALARLWVQLLGIFHRRGQL